LIDQAADRRYGLGCVAVDEEVLVLILLQIAPVGREETERRED